MKEENQNWLERLSPGQRFQHILVMISFIILIVTGLVLKFHENWFSRLVINLEGGIIARGIFHRLAAAILMFVSLVHFLHIVFTERGHKDFLLMLPRKKDFSDAILKVGFILGLSEKEPKFDKYAPKDKFQYWAVVLGSLLMIVTGLVLWFQSQAMLVLPKWVFDITAVLHGYQGVLIGIVVILWHLYNVHLNPKDFPMSKVWLDGKISLEELKKEHPLQYEREYKNKIQG